MHQIACMFIMLVLDQINYLVTVKFWDFLQTLCYKYVYLWGVRVTTLMTWSLENCKLSSVPAVGEPLSLVPFLPLLPEGASEGTESPLPFVSATVSTSITGLI